MLKIVRDMIINVNQCDYDHCSRYYLTNTIISSVAGHNYHLLDYW